MSFTGLVDEDGTAIEASNLGVIEVEIPCEYERYKFYRNGKLCLMCEINLVSV